MKSIISALLIFSLLITITSCNNKSTTQESTAETQHTSATTNSSSHTTSISSSVSLSSQISSADTELTTTPDNNSIETGTPQQMSDSDYMGEAPIPSVAWTEINIDKTMYTQSQCTGYEFALSDANGKMIYDAGIGLEIIARTSTGYYRTINDYYIPCDCLDNNIPENVDPVAATSCTVYVPPVVTKSVSSEVTVPPATTLEMS